MTPRLPRPTSTGRFLAYEQGLRDNELSQLYVDDIIDLDGT